MTLSKRIIIDCELTDEHVLSDLVKAIEIITGYMTDNVIVRSQDRLGGAAQVLFDKILLELPVTPDPLVMTQNSELIAEYRTATPERQAEIARHFHIEPEATGGQ